MNGNNKKVKKIFIILLVAICSYYAISLCLMGTEQIKKRIETKEILLPIYIKYGYEISVFINTKQTEFVYLTNKPIFKKQKELSSGLKNADIQVHGDISLLKEFQGLEAMIISMETDSDLSVLKNFSNLQYIAFDEVLNQKRIYTVHKILPKCNVEDYWDTHPSWNQKFE